MGLFDKLKKKDEKGENIAESSPAVPTNPVVENTNVSDSTIPAVAPATPTPPVIPDGTFSAPPTPTEVSSEPTLADNNDVAQTTEVVTENPLPSVSETAATIEAPNPILEQQIALDVNPEEVFEGGPTTMYDEITNIVSKEVNSSESSPSEDTTASTSEEIINLTNGPVDGLPDQTAESANNTIVEDVALVAEEIVPESEVPVITIEPNTEPVTDIASVEAVIPPEIATPELPQEVSIDNSVEPTLSAVSETDLTPLSESDIVSDTAIEQPPIEQSGATVLPSEPEGEGISVVEPPLEPTEVQEGLPITENEPAEQEVPPVITDEPVTPDNEYSHAPVITEVPISEPDEEITTIDNESTVETENIEPVIAEEPGADSSHPESTPSEPIENPTVTIDNADIEQPETTDDAPSSTDDLEDTMDLPIIDENTSNAEISTINSDEEIPDSQISEEPAEITNTEEQEEITNAVNEIYSEIPSTEEASDGITYEEGADDEIIEGDDITYVDEDGNIITEEPESSETDTPEDELPSTTSEDSETASEGSESAESSAEEPIAPIIEEDENDLVLEPEASDSSSTPESEEPKPIIEEEESDIVIPGTEEPHSEENETEPVISEAAEDIPIISSEETTSIADLDSPEDNATPDTSKEDSTEDEEESIILNHNTSAEEENTVDSEADTVNPFAEITPSAIALDIVAEESKDHEEKEEQEEPEEKTFKDEKEFNPLLNNFDYKEKLKEYANMFDHKPQNNKSEKTYISEPTKTKFCNNCGIMLTDDSSICPSCGEPVD